MEELARVDRPLLEERHHPVRPWLVAGMLALVVLGLAGAFYYSPLASGELTCTPPAELIAAPESEEGVEAAERCLVEQQPEPADFAVETVIRNTGRLPMTVEAVQLPEGMAELLELRDVRVAPPGGASEDSSGASGPRPQPGSMAPLRLGPGQARRLELHLTLEACGDHSDRLITASNLPLRVRFLGLPKTTEVALGTEFSVLRRRC